MMASRRFGDLDDTTPAAQQRLLSLLRGMTAADRFASALDASRRLRETAYAGLRLHHPAATPEELDRRYAELVLPPDLCRRFLDARHRG